LKVWNCLDLSCLWARNSPQASTSSGSPTWLYNTSTLAQLESRVDPVPVQCKMRVNERRSKPGAILHKKEAKRALTALQRISEKHSLLVRGPKVQVRPSQAGKTMGFVAYHNVRCPSPTAHLFGSLLVKLRITSAQFLPSNDTQCQCSILKSDVC